MKSPFPLLEEVKRHVLKVLPVTTLWDCVLCIQELDLDRDCAVVFCELERIRQEVEQDLEVSIIVSRDRCEEACILLLKEVDEFDPLLLCLVAEGVHSSADDCMEIERGRVEIELRILHARQVQ